MPMWSARSKTVIISVVVLAIVISLTMAGILGGFQKLYNYTLMSLDAKTDLIILNEGGNVDNSSGLVDAVSLSKELQQSFLKLKGRFLSEDGKSVNYTGIRNSTEFSELEEKAQKFKFIDLGTLQELEKKALYLNLYNIMTIHALVRSKPVKSVLDLTLFWKKMSYNIGGHIISLDILEHGLIRGNRPHPTSKKSLLPDDSELLKYTVKELDPRIHFALNCGAKSCPAIRIYTAENIETALESSAKLFCSTEVSIDVDTNTVTLSQILEWYGVDFGSNKKEVVTRISAFLSPEEREKLEKIPDDKRNIQYKKYDWGLNSA